MTSSSGPICAFTPESTAALAELTRIQFPGVVPAQTTAQPTTLTSRTMMTAAGNPT